MDLGNNVTLIGVLKKKEKHANNPDIKRPVLELEIVYFEKTGESRPARKGGSEKQCHKVRCNSRTQPFRSF